jgi:hemin uptake protein HemP
MNCVSMMARMRTILNIVLMQAPSRPTDPKPEPTSNAEPHTVSSEELLGGRRQLIIQHGGERYRLLVTRSNKLILTK